MAATIYSIDSARPHDGASGNREESERARCLLAPPSSTPDAALLRLVLEAKALDRELAQAEADLAAAMSRVAPPCIPDALTVTVFDVGVFARLQLRAGDSLSLLDVQTIRAFRDGLVKLVGDTPLKSLRRTVERANQIDEAAERYFAQAAQARLAAGVTAAENRATSCAEALGRLYRQIARTPARSLLGVLAKLDAVAVPLAASAITSEDGEMDEPADVATAAAADLAALTGGAAPVMFDIGAADRRHMRAASASDVELLAHIAEGRRLDREITALVGDHRTIPDEDVRKLREADQAYRHAFASALNTVPQTLEGLREVLTWVQRRCEGAPLPHDLTKAFLRSALASPVLADHG